MNNDISNNDSKGINPFSNMISELENDKYHSHQSLLPLLEHKSLSLSTIILTSIKLGCLSFGGSNRHISLIKSTFIEKEYIDEVSFNNIVDLCLLLPGYSSSILLSALVIANTKNLLYSIVSLLSYNLPSLFAIVIISHIMNIVKANVRPSVLNYDPDAKYFSMYYDPFMFSLWVLAAGVAQSALALLIEAGIKLVKKLSNNTFQYILVILSLGIYLYNGEYNFMLMVMIISGIASMVKGDHDYLFGIPKSNEDAIFTSIPYTGIGCIIVYLVILGILRAFSEETNKANIFIMLSISWIKMGAISIGEGNVMIPMILSEYKTIVEEAEVLNGYALVKLLPGSMLNTAAYIGVITSNVFGGILSGILIFIPGFLFMLTALPYFKSIKYNTGFQFFIRGANSAAVGFVFACAMKLWYDSCIVNPYTSHLWGSLNVILCFVLSYKVKVHKTFVLMLGAMFNLMMEVLMHIAGKRI